jgi:hypothetical protein
MEQITFKASSIAEAIIGLLKEESRDKNYVEVFGCTDGTVVAYFVEDYDYLDPQYRAIWQNMRASELHGVESLTPQEAVEKIGLEDLTFDIKTVKVFTD